jgi:signal transduction histidine kinase
MARIKTRTQSYVFWLGLIPLLLAAASWRIYSRYSECLNSVAYAREVLQRTNNLLAAVTGAETGQRGFLLTGKDVYLQPFLDSERSIERELKQFTPVLLAEGNDPETVKRLDRLILDKLEELRTTVRLRQTAGRQPALDLVETDLGQRNMTSIRQIMTLLQNHEQALLRGRQETLRQLRAKVVALFACGILTSFLLVGLVYRANRRFLLEQEKKENQLNQINAELEQRVQDRTFQLELRTTELELRTQELQQSNADLESFAFVASHDLQEPLRMISAFGALLHRQYHQKLDKQADEFIEFMVNSAQHMQLLIDDLLQYARIGNQEVKEEQFLLREALEAACEPLQEKIAEAGAALEAVDLPLVWGNRQMLAQVFSELIGNSLKFGRPGQKPTITISATPHNATSWKIAVQDNGIGFDPQYRDVIFRMFQTLHSKAKYPGTGVGLAICKRIVEQHGGKLWVESFPGTGSTFYFTLPKVQQHR